MKAEKKKRHYSLKWISWQLNKLVHGSHSTRYVHIELPKGVHYFPNGNSYKQFRVVRKNKIYGYQSWYFNTLKEAIDFNKEIRNES